MAVPFYIVQSGPVLTYAESNPPSRVDVYFANLLHAWQTADPAYLARGLSWYDDARAIVRALADNAGMPHKMATATTAILSQDSSWDKNIVGLGEVLSAYKNGADECPESAHRYGKIRDKVTAVLRGADPLWVMHNYGGKSDAYKIRHFFLNLMGDTTVATIDRHIYRACARDEVKGTVPQGKVYLDCQTALIRLADRLGISVERAQAALWNAILEETGNVTPVAR